MGANDFINNYLVPIASTIQQVFVTPDSFIDQVMTTYRAQLMRLYEMDARKILVANVGPIGCIPYERTLNRVDENQCAALPNELALKFNKRLRPLIMELNANCKGATFVYANCCWKRPLLHFLLCFVLGFLIGFTPLVTS